ncbi:MAG: 2-hydroxyacyl-CoA dehydratase [Anaerolineae bacterium]
MSEKPDSDQLVGRGRKEGARLFREWFDDLAHAGERGEQAAYVFVMGSMAEILRTFDSIKSCRTTSTGLADSRRFFMKDRDLPSLYIESDMMDKRVVSEAQLKNRIDAFFEGLSARKQQAAVS